MMTTNQKIGLMNRWFVHRTDAYLEQWVNEDGTHYATKQEPFTNDHVLKHLQGTKTFSTYPMSTDDTVKWICFDVDVSPKARKDKLTDEENTENTQRTVKRVAKMLNQLGVGFKVERSGSKGYHLWVFFDKPIVTRKAYIFGQFIQVHLPANQYVNVEVFPKHERYEENSFSFGVKMPLGIHRKTNVRCFFIRGTFEPYEDQWKIFDTIKPLTEGELDAIIKEWGIKDVEEAPLQIYTPNPDYICMKRIMTEGVDNGNRDAGIFQLACYLQSQGMPHEIAETVLERVPDNGTPPLTDQQRDIKLKSAYAKQYYPSPCRDDNLDSFCSSSCRRWDNKVSKRWTKFGADKKQAAGNISRD